MTDCCHLSVCSDPSTFLWDDEVGETHEIRQGEALDSMAHLKKVARSLEEGERLFAFLDDLYVIYQTECKQSTEPLFGICGTKPGFHCTMVSPRCGTGEASPPVVRPTSDFLLKPQRWAEAVFL